jgi:CHAT domain-containing protein
MDPAYPPLLCAQVRVGRWLPPRPRARGQERPAQPPAVKVDVGHMAVVTGDYLAMNGTRPLPEAQAEGDALTGRYDAVRLTATWEDLDRLLRNCVEKEGRQVDIELMHFACHGQVDLSNPANNGIVLNSGHAKLDPTTALGCEIGEATQPFVFMNACEVGMADETLGSYGGLAGSFLNEGFRGFVAPLWAVNDKLAHQLALKFYEQTLAGGEPVSEAMRALRVEYDPGAQMPSATPLAYVYYGHPDLVLERR